MKLNDICKNLQMKIVGHTGAIVECMNNDGSSFLEKGKYYKVLDIDTIWSQIYVSIERHSMSVTYKPGRFRLVVN